MEKNHKLLMKTAMLAGELLLSSGAETYRVEDTMRRMLNKSELEHIEVFVVLTGIMATLDDESIEPISYVKAVKDVGMNINKIIVVNDVSRKYCNNEITLEEAYNRLNTFKWKKYNIALYSLATVGIVTGFSMFFGGDFCDIVATAVVGIILAAFITFGKRFRVNGFIHNILNCIGISFVAMLLQLLWNDINTEIVIISSIMPLVPGVSLTNGVRDVLEGDYISGNSRILKAFLVAAGIAIGIGAGMAIFELFF